MTRAALLGGAIVAAGCVAGCNAIFGLDEQRARPVDAKKTLLFHLDYLAVETPGADPVVRPIPGLTKVLAGPAGQPLVEQQVDDSGVVALPIELRDTVIRVRFTLPTETFTREVVMTATDEMHYPVPLAGVAARPAPPTNSEISFSVLDTPSAFVAPRIYTTGAVWSASTPLATSPPITTNFTKSPSTTSPLAGPLTKLDNTSDIWLVDYSSSTIPFASIGFGASKVETLPETTSSASPPPHWNAPATADLDPAPFNIAATADGQDGANLTSVLNGHVGVVASNNYSGGVVPSVQLAVSTKMADDETPDDGAYIPLAVSNAFGSFPNLINPFPSTFPIVIRGRVAASRTLMGRTLVSGYQSFFANNATINHNVGIAAGTSIEDALALVQVPLDGADFDSTVPLTSNGTKPVTVGFTLDDSADACEVAAYSVGSTITELASVDVMRDPSLVAGTFSATFDPSPFIPSAFATDRDYIVRITCRREYFGDALRAGQLDKVVYPARTSTNWTAAFHTVVK